MNDSVSGVSLSSLGEIVAVIVPVAVGVAFLFKNTQSLVKAAVDQEAQARHTLARTVQERVGILDLRTTALERDSASRKDLDAAEARINTHIGDVKADVRETRTNVQSILEKVAGLAATLTKEKRAVGGD